MQAFRDEEILPDEGVQGGSDRAMVVYIGYQNCAKLIRSRRWHRSIERRREVIHLHCYCDPHVRAFTRPNKPPHAIIQNALLFPDLISPTSNQSFREEKKRDQDLKLFPTRHQQQMVDRPSKKETTHTFVATKPETQEWMPTMGTINKGDRVQHKNGCHKVTAKNQRRRRQHKKRCHKSTTRNQRRR